MARRQKGLVGGLNRMTGDLKGFKKDIKKMQKALNKDHAVLGNQSFADLARGRSKN